MYLHRDNTVAITGGGGGGGGIGHWGGGGIAQQGFFYMHHPTDRVAHTTAFITPVVEHWLEREILVYADIR